VGRGRILLVVALALALTPASAAGQAGGSYQVPADNPFVGQAGARPEIYSYGLRNPWRFSFDRAGGDLVISDVGQDAVEEVNFAAAGQGAGDNYGWNCFEGSVPFERAPAGCSAPGHVPPVLEYSSDSPNLECSITGGYVARDPALPIAGRYVYGDFCTGELRSAVLAPTGSSDDRSLNLDVPALSSFGEDAAGRLYAVSLGGPVLRFRGAAGQVLLEPVGLFNTPVYVTSQPDDADRLYVVEKGGRIQLVKNGIPASQPFLDISADVATDNLERGLLSVAFAPDYTESGLFYVDYNNRDGDITIEEFRRSPDNPDVADPTSRRVVLTQEHSEFGNHNGGQLNFGPDGLLYASIGDGGGADDPHRNGQDPGTLLGKIIRIDPRPAQP
jgi:glucose/arabinose dehydrogenase